MINVTRKLGIDVVNEAPWGTHLCQFYKTKKDLTDVLVPYFTAGLENNEFCMWVTSPPLNEEEALKALKKAVPSLDEYLEKGQIEIIPYDQWYLIDNVFDMHKDLKGWVSKLDGALARGYDGLRLTGNTFWLEKKDWKSFTEYEAVVDGVINKYKILAICTYSLDRCGASEIIDVVTNHQFALVKREKKWEVIQSEGRKKTEEKIAHLASFPEMNPYSVCEFDLKGNIIYLNPTSRRLFPDLEANGLSHPYLADFKSIILPALKSGKTNFFVRDIKIEDAYFEQNFFHPPKSQSIRIYGIDITELKKAEEALKKSSQRLGILSETASQLLSSKEPQQIIESICKKVLNYLDCHVFFNYLVDEEKQQLHLNACTGVPEKVAKDIEWLDFGVAVCGCVARDGKRIIAENIQETSDPRANLVRSFGIKAYACHPLLSKGRVIGTLSFGTCSKSSFKDDELVLMKAITDQVAVAMERKKGEDSLQKAYDALDIRVKERTRELEKVNEEVWSASLYARSLIEASLDPLVTISPEGKITDVNEATIKVTGVSRKELIGTDFSDYFTEPEKAREGYQRVFSKSFVTDYPLTIRHKDGHLTDVLYNASVYKDVRGNVFGVFAAARDVTERKRTETELAKYRDHLEELVKERTKELEAFSYSVSHDLRAPLRIVHGFSQILLEDYRDKIDDEGKRVLNVIQNNINKMGHLIDDLLSLSRLGRQDIRISRIEMEALVKNVFEELKSTVPEKKKLNLYIKSLYPVDGDISMIRQVFINLISNAIKFTQPKENPAIEIGSWTNEKENVYYIKDNGVGFDMKYVDKVFMVFQRLHKEDEFEGTGIGLAIVNRIIQRHGGKVWAEGRVNEGATFYFTLPKA